MLTSSRDRCPWSWKEPSRCSHALVLGRYIRSYLEALLPKVGSRCDTHASSRADTVVAELAKRIEDAQPKAILAASCGLEPKGIIDYKVFVDQALGFSSHKAPVLMLRRTKIKGHDVPELNASKGELDWAEEVERVKKGNKAVEECEEVSSRCVGGSRTGCDSNGVDGLCACSHPLYILYTSGKSYT